MAAGEFLHLRLFLEGVEVPIISAVTQAQPNAPAACSIQILPHDYAYTLKPRTLVHVFFYDTYAGTPAESAVSVGGPGIRVQDRDDGIDPEIQGLFPPERWESMPEQTLADLHNENYKVFFAGEVVGVQFNKNPQQRSIMLQCVDFSGYWDIAYQYQVSGLSLGGGGIKAAFTGASTTLFNDFLDGSGDIVARLFATPPRSYPQLRGTVLGGIVHIIEAIGGVYYGTRAIRGTNDFFALAEIRLHITQMLGANPYPESDERRLLSAHGFGSMFSHGLRGLGKMVTVRAVLNSLSKYVFHEVVPITSPRFIPALTDPNVPQYETVSLGSDRATAPLQRAAENLRDMADELVERQEACTDATAVQRQSRLRGSLRSQLVRSARIARLAASRARHVGSDIQNDTYRDFFSLPQVAGAFASASKILGQLSVLVQEQDQRGRLFVAGTQQANTVISLAQQLSNSMQTVLETQYRKRAANGRTQQPDPPPRFLQQIYRPDVWMVAPPRCNVFFPENYSQFSYGRDFQAEVSRLLLRTHDAFFGSDILFDGFYMAPSTVHGNRRGRSIMRGSGEPPDMSDSPVSVIRDLMDHELYTGIIPQFERMSDLNLHAIRGGSVTVGNVRVGYAQLAANHIFFQYRFKSRQLQLSGPFNPYVVLGFPCLVIDKYMGEDALRGSTYDTFLAENLADAIREGEGEFGAVPADERVRIHEANNARIAEIRADIETRRADTQYLGTPMMITHSANANQGGQTQVQMGYARTTDERTEFLGDATARTTRVRRTRNRTVTTAVACLDEPQAGTRGPRGGKITEVVEVTDRYANRAPRRSRRGATGQDAFVGGVRLKLFVTGRAYFSGRARTGTRVVVGVEQAAASYGPEVVALVGTAGGTQSATADSSETLVTFKAYDVTEEIGVYNREAVNVPPEDLVFPPWYGEHYRSNRIGGLYSYFFGTGAITDPTTILAPGANPQHFDGSTLDGQEATDGRVLNVALSSGIKGISAIAEDQPDGEAPGGGMIGEPGTPRSMEDTEVLGRVENQGSIDIATREIIKAYSRVKLGGYNVTEFIRAYTWRPIASMVDMFGTSNLEITDQGEVVRGREGFHSRAFGDFDDLRQIIGESPDGSRPQTILGLHIDNPDETGAANARRSRRDQQISARLDTRKDKRAEVLRYLNAILTQRGLIG